MRHRINCFSAIIKLAKLYLIEWPKFDLVWRKCFICEWTLHCVQIMCSHGNNTALPARQYPMIMQTHSILNIPSNVLVQLVL